MGDSNPNEKDSRHIETNGGMNNEGQIHQSGGQFISGNVQGNVSYNDHRVTLTEAATYDVRSLPDNPYLGLKDFEYEDKEYYAGREEYIKEAKRKLTTLVVRKSLLFVTGASGSGKSSFVKAGLLPALKQFYEQEKGLLVLHQLIRPAAQPLARLLYALNSLGLKTSNWPVSLDSPEDFNRFLHYSTPPNQVNLLIIDQLEESFIQAEGSRELTIFLNILANLSNFETIHTHIIVTLRADYIAEFFNQEALYNSVKDGVELRVMKVVDLKKAILRPLQYHYPQRKDAFEPALVQKLAEEAAGNVAYLPLLQLTLRQLWSNGLLRLSAYEVFSLPIVVNNWADKVLKYRDYDRQNSSERRTKDEHQEMLKLLIDLVDVSPTSDNRSDVRHARPRLELEQNNARRKSLIHDMIDARLLNNTQEPNAQGDGEIEVVEIIHDTLINQWDKLSKEIDENRQKIKQPQARFELALRLWLDSNKNKDRLLQKKVELDEARYLEKIKNIALESKEAQDFYRLCLEAEIARRRQRYIIAGVVIGVTFIILLIAIVVSVMFAIEATSQANTRATAQAIAEDRRVVAVTAQADAITQKDAAQHQSKISLSRQLAAQSQTNLITKLDLSLLLSIEATRISDTVEARESLFNGVNYIPGLLIFLRGHSGSVSDVVFSSDGKILASSSGDRTIILWDTTTWKMLGNPLSSHKDSVESVAFSPDGKTLASGSLDKTIILWDINTRSPIAILKGHSGTVLNVTFSPDGKTIASGSSDTTVRLWNVSDRKEIGQLIGHTSYVSRVVFSPDGKTIASGSYDHSIKLWDVAKKEQIGKILQGHTDGILSLVFSPDGKNLASGSFDDTIRFWDVLTQEQVGQPYIGFSDIVESLAFSPDGKTIVSGSYDRIIRIWDVSKKETAYRSISAHAGGVWSIAFSPDGKLLASSSADKTIKLFNRLTGVQIGEDLLGHNSSVNSIAFSPDGKTIASGSGDTTVRLWDVATRKQIEQPLLGHTDIVRSVAFSSNGKILATGGDDTTIRIWDIAGRQQINQLNPGSAVRSLVFSPDGKFIISGDNKGRIYLWDTATGGQIGQPLLGHELGILSIAISPDGKTIASGSYDGIVRLWDVATRKQIGQPLLGHTDFVYSVVFSPDGKLLASGSADRLIRLWEVNTGKLVDLPLSRHTDGILSLSFSPDGKILASGSFDRTIHLRELNLNNPVKQACKLANRNLTQQEWTDFIGEGEPYEKICPALSSP